MAIHPPKLRLIRLTVEIGRASCRKSVQISDPDDLERKPHKGRVAVLAHHRGPSDDPMAIHRPKLGFVAVPVMPDYTGSPVTGQIADPDDLERQPHKGRVAVLAHHRGPPDDPMAIHPPKLRLIRLTV